MKNIGNLYNVSHSTVNSHLKKWDVDIRPPKTIKTSKLEKYREEMIRLYKEEHLSTIDLSNMYKESVSTIHYTLKEIWNVKIRSYSEMSKYKVNGNFFNSISSEEQAYWLGFMYADGYISKEYIGIALAIKDINHLEKLKLAIESNHNVKTYKTKSNDLVKSENYYGRLLFKNSKMSEDLKKLGCIENKSLKLKFPSNEIVPSKYMRHFIRGYFDGDGSLVLSNNSINFKILGTSDFLKGLIKCLNENIDGYEFKENLQENVKGSEKDSFYISYGGRFKTKAVMDWIYGGSTVFLERKFNKYLKLNEI